jgi:hypothetical protein
MLRYLIFFIIVLIIFSVCFYHFNYTNDVNKRKSVHINKRRSILIELYNIIIDAAEATNTKPFLIYGTLLGFVRNKDLICYDYDLDFGIDKSQFSTISKYLNNHIENFPEYKIANKNIFGHYNNIEIIHRNMRLSADIFSFSLKNNMYSRDIPKLYSKYYLKEKYVSYPKEWIAPLQRIYFLDRYAHIPNITDNLLYSYYGKNFIIPDHTCNSDCSICKKI